MRENRPLKREIIYSLCLVCPGSAGRRREQARWKREIERNREKIDLKKGTVYTYFALSVLVLLEGEGDEPGGEER